MLAKAYGCRVLLSGHRVHDHTTRTVHMGEIHVLDDNSQVDGICLAKCLKSVSYKRREQSQFMQIQNDIAGAEAPLSVRYCGYYAEVTWIRMRYKSV